MRRNLTQILMFLTIAVAVLTGAGDLAGRSFICESSACVKIHSSSLATAFAIPVGFYAAGFLILALWLYRKGKTDFAGAILCGLLGIESYFTFIQAFFIRSFCLSCLLFFVSLAACAFSSRATVSRNAAIHGFMLFFVAHFCFFFPSVNLKPTLITDPGQINTEVEIFASPSCSHCEEALSVLRTVCDKANTSLIVRPVSISKADSKKSAEWVAGKLFSRGSPTSLRLAEKIVWDNEAEARRLNNDNLAVPLILVKTNGEKELFTGWNAQVRQAVFGLIRTGLPETASANLLIRKTGFCPVTSCND